MAGTADTADNGEGADPDSDLSDDDTDQGNNWPGSSDDWARIYSIALGLSNPVRRCDQTEKQKVATLFSGTEAPMKALETLTEDTYLHTVSCYGSPANRQFIFR